MQFPHVVAAGLTTGAFFVLGISAYHILRKSNLDFFRRSFQIASVIGVIAVLMVIFNGHAQTQHMVEIQPMKIAAADAIAGILSDDEILPDYIIPSVFDRRVATAVAEAVSPGDRACSVG